jgi:ribose 5-phosphate isomerase B
MADQVTIAIGSDHAGFHMKTLLAGWLEEEGHQVARLGALSTDRYDYPCASDEVASKILSGSAKFGILICGSGVGVCIRANRYPGIRAAQCFTVEMAELSRQHNHANVLCLGERIQEYKEMQAIVRAFLATVEDLEARHAARVNLLDAELNLNS